MSTATLPDPARFAHEIRTLAQDSHHALTHSPSTNDLRRLSRRILDLSAQLRHNPRTPLALWLKNLHRAVRASRRARTLCLCR